MNPDDLVVIDTGETSALNGHSGRGLSVAGGDFYIAVDNLVLGSSYWLGAPIRSAPGRGRPDVCTGLVYVNHFVSPEPNV